jgi:hypothetical protein
MPRLARLALLLALAPGAVSAAPQALPVQQNAPAVAAGAWRGGPVADDQGRVQACAMMAPAGEAQMFFRLSTGFDFSFGLINRRWRFQGGEVLPMVYWIDGGGRTETQARANGSNTLIMDIADRESIFQQFRRGLWLYLAAQGSTFRFSLKGTSVALEQLRLCATTLAATAPTEPPRTPEPPRGGK